MQTFHDFGVPYAALPKTPCKFRFQFMQQKRSRTNCFVCCAFMQALTNGGSPYVRKNYLIRSYQSQPPVCQLFHAFAAFQSLRFFLQTAVFFMCRGDLRPKLRRLLHGVLQVLLNAYQAQDSICGQHRKYQSHQSRRLLHSVRPCPFSSYFLSL